MRYITRIINDIAKFLLPEKIYSTLGKIYIWSHRKAYCQEIDKRSSLSMTDIIGHAREISPRIYASYDIYHFNGFYGSSHVLKVYANRSERYSIKAYLQHGVNFGDWHDELVPLPSYLIWGKQRQEIIKNRTKRDVFVIGAPFFYAVNFLSDEKIQSERSRLGKNLLVFPVHSIPRVECIYNIEKFISQLHELECIFDSIRICLYYCDIQRGMHEKYLENNFECVTAGHQYDVNFLARLKSLIMISDATLANHIGSYSGYSVFLGRPHRLLLDNYEFKSRILFSNLKMVEREDKAYREDMYYQEIEKMFADNISFKCLPEHIDVIDPYWGFSELKTKEELREIFMKTEVIYSKEGFVPYR
jgi:hypothetical protein